MGLCYECKDGYYLNPNEYVGGCLPCDGCRTCFDAYPICATCSVAGVFPDGSGNCITACDATLGYGCLDCGQDSDTGAQNCYKCRVGYRFDPTLPLGTCIKTSNEFCHSTCAPSGKADTDPVDFVNCVGPYEFDCLKCVTGYHQYTGGVTPGRCDPCEGVGVKTCTSVGVAIEYRSWHFGPNAEGCPSPSPLPLPTPSSYPFRHLQHRLPHLYLCQQLSALHRCYNPSRHRLPSLYGWKLPGMRLLPVGLLHEMQARVLRRHGQDMLSLPDRKLS